jgi:hypothetical protein
MAQHDPLSPQLEQMVNLGLATVQEMWQLQLWADQLAPGESMLMPDELEPLMSRLWLVQQESTLQ